MAWLLAFDTSTEHMSVALSGPHTQPLGGTWPGGAAASAGLLPRIEALRAEAGIAWSAVDAIAFGQGPGAFTGLRTACSVAQGLGFALARPLVPVDSLSIVAEDALAQRGGDGAFETWVAMDARMDEVYAGAYRIDGAAWQVLRLPALWTLPALQAAWAVAPPAAVVGSALQAFGERLPAAAALRFVQPLDRAQALMRRARALWAQGAVVDAADALPLYLRDKVALTRAERQARTAQAKP